MSQAIGEAVNTLGMTTQKTILDYEETDEQRKQREATDISLRNDRQNDFLPTELLDTLSAYVIGVGAVGRQIALQLASMGVASLTLIDFDTVEAVNLGPQGYLESDLGSLKVTATAKACQALNTSVNILSVPERFQVNQFVKAVKSDVFPVVVFSCVDNMDARSVIFNTSKSVSTVRVLIDTRMLGEVLNVYTAVLNDETSRDKYASSLYSSSEASRERCTAKTSIYCANIVAGLAVCQFSRWLRNTPVDKHVNLSLFSMELDVAR